MLIIGLDYHPSVQQIAFVDLETGETGERQLNHNEGEVEEFYRELKQRGINVRVGMEATGSTCWFEPTPEVASPSPGLAFQATTRNTSSNAPTAIAIRSTNR